MEYRRFLDQFTDSSPFLEKQLGLSVLYHFNLIPGSYDFQILVQAGEEATRRITETIQTTTGKRNLSNQNKLFHSSSPWNPYSVKFDQNASGKYYPIRRRQWRDEEIPHYHESKHGPFTQPDQPTAGFQENRDKWIQTQTEKIQFKRITSQHSKSFCPGSPVKKYRPGCPIARNSLYRLCGWRSTDKDHQQSLEQCPEICPR